MFCSLLWFFMPNCNRKVFDCELLPSKKKKKRLIIIINGVQFDFFFSFFFLHALNPHKLPGHSEIWNCNSLLINHCFAYPLRISLAWSVCDTVNCVTRIMGNIQLAPSSSGNWLEAGRCFKSSVVSNPPPTLFVSWFISLHQSHLSE